MPDYAETQHPAGEDAGGEELPSTPTIQRLPPQPGRRSRRSKLLHIVVLLATGATVTLWLIGTPPGLQGKAHAVGYAICHQIEERTFSAGGVVMPLCARCTGMFLGVIVGLVGPLLMGRGRAGQMPPPLVLGVLGFFSVMWAGDGFNSYLHLFPNTPGLYTPHNTLRLLTGSLHGLTMAGLIYPVFHQSVWRHWRHERSLQNLRELGVLVLGVLAFDALLLLRQPLLLTLLGLLSTLGVLLIMTVLQTVIVILFTGQANTLHDWPDLVLPAILGFGLAIAMIGGIDAMRLRFTGTWAGFMMPE